MSSRAARREFFLHAPEVAKIDDGEKHGKEHAYPVYPELGTVKGLPCFMVGVIYAEKAPAEERISCGSHHADVNLFCVKSGEQIL